MSNNYLQHYGVLGMKWGVRRSQKRLARIDKKAKKQNWSEDAKSAAEIKTKKLKQMSNADLKKLNERTRLENEYKNLKKSRNLGSRTINAGKKFAGDVLRETGKEIAKDYTKKRITKGIEFAKEFYKNHK